METTSAHIGKHVLEVGGYFPEAQSIDDLFGERSQTVESQPGFFTLHLAQSVIEEAEEVIYFVLGEHSFIGRAVFIHEPRDGRWKNVGSNMLRADPRGRLDHLESAVWLAEDIDALLQRDARHDHVMKELAPHIQNIVHAAHELPGEYLKQINRVESRLPSSMRVNE